MINVVYLVIVFSLGSAGSTSETIPQASMKQCEINQKSMLSENRVKEAYCIVGVK